MKREDFEKSFPSWLPIEQLPPVRGKLVDKMKTPFYMAGWTMTMAEIREKWDPNDNWRSVHGVDKVLMEKWRKYKADPERPCPFRKIPSETQNGVNNDSLFYIAMNYSQDEMDELRLNHKAAFNLMCELFDVKTEEEKKKMQERFKWYRMF